jgi:hypothetical protein
MEWKEEVNKAIERLHKAGPGCPVYACPLCDQPERSKREDSEWGAKCDFGLLKSEMRCSEHCGNTMKEVQ